MMEICEEMKKLRSYLDDHGIEWIDQSEEDKNPKFLDMSIYRTWFDLNGERCSVVNGFGTWGGWTHRVDNLGLLEMMYRGEVEGHLTADDIIKKIEVYSHEK